jgi:hypothetical protein
MSAVLLQEKPVPPPSPIKAGLDKEKPLAASRLREWEIPVISSAAIEGDLIVSQDMIEIRR